MDLASLDGQTFGPYSMRVCLEKVNEYVDITGGERARWAEAAPPGFLAAALFVVAPELLGKLTNFSVLHGEQTFRWLQPLTMESELLVSGTVTKVRERGGTHFVGFDITVTGVDYEVAGGTSLFLVSESSSNSNAESSGAPENDPLHRGNPEPGQRAASRSDLVRYAAATRDWNPIHWDHGTALAAGLPGVVAHGLLQAAWALEAASHGVPGDHPFDSAKFRFRHPLLTATPVDVIVTDAGRQKTVSLTNAAAQYLTAQIVLTET